MKALKVALIAIAVVALAGFVWWYWYTGRPQYSLMLLANAVKAKDYETARYFVDDERIADTASKSVLEAAIQRLTKDMKASENPFSGLGIAAVQMMAPRIREAAKDNIKDAIRQALSGNDTLTSRAGATQQWDLSQRSQLRIEMCVVSGNTAEVLIGGIPQPNPVQLSEIHLRMARVSNSRNWRVEEIPEISQAYVKLWDTEQRSAQTSPAEASAVQSGPPAVTVSTPNRILDQTAASICGIDFRNSRMYLGNDWSAVLTNGHYEKHADLQSEYVDVKDVVCFDVAGSGEHALVTTEWRGCGADCQMSGVVQVFGLRDGHPIMTQQIEFDSKAEGTGATFDKDALTLTVIGRSRHEEDEAECCPKNLDVVVYRWEGQQFVQSRYKRIPVPSS